MFGKINFGLSSQSKPNNNQFQNNSTSQTQNNKPIQQSNNSQSNKSFLSNPKFNSISKNNQSIPNSNKSSHKQQQKQQSNNSKHENKTKLIKKQPFNNNLKKNNPQQNKLIKQKPNQSLQSQMQGSKFRILNELLYTSSSQQAMNHFKSNPQDYFTYHQGYRYQSQKWQSKPVNVIIKYFKRSFKSYKDKIICDLGCGQGFLYEALTKQKYQKINQQGQVNQVKNKHTFKPQNILSYDLVAMKPFVKVADISNLPLQKQSTDVFVFCLSLMGKNYIEFIKQAHRILKQKTGQLIIAQVQSRSKSWKTFIQMIQMLGFQLINNGVNIGTKRSQNSYNHQQNKHNNQNNKKDENNSNRYFRILQFNKKSQNSQLIKKIKYQGQYYTKQNLLELSQLLLTQCIYKKR